jgi:predicted nucleic acid-binding protein
MIPGLKRPAPTSRGISSTQDILVPSATMLELDLELKTHGVNDSTRAEIHARLARLIPSSRVLPLTSEVLGRAAELSKVARWRGSYFDTMIAATGLEYKADAAITTDRKFSNLGLKTPSSGQFSPSTTYSSTCV